MKSNLTLRLVLLLSIGMLAFSSCERLFDEDPHYSYRVRNELKVPVELVVQVNPEANVEVVGDPKLYYTLAPGDMVEVWATSGFTTGEVWHEEAGKQEIYWFSVSATSTSRPARSNLNATGRWTYHKTGDYSATYTLTLIPGDF